MVTGMFERFYEPGKVFPLSKVLEYLRAHPEAVVNNLTESLPEQRVPFLVREDYKKHVVPRKYRDMAERADQIRFEYVNRQPGGACANSSRTGFMTRGRSEDSTA